MEGDRVVFGDEITDQRGDLELQFEQVGRIRGEDVDKGGQTWQRRHVPPSRLVIDSQSIHRYGYGYSYGYGLLCDCSC